ncbi:Ferric iron ABC transporter, permease protein [hydrothermal vent metagenome]|uniref:Ferric iron ABC transporter, permease protein n=1 Tax=hydrothermal vent metagenome TaxID=652676 RepID=A0A3B0VUI7_9ZZZZ
MAALFCLPFLALFLQLLTPDIDLWQHLFNTVLNTYLSHSVLMMVGVGGGALILGVSSAWLVAAHGFPGQRYFTWLLILPLAMPAYIVAYAYTWFLDVSGPLQSTLRTITGGDYGDYMFPNIRSIGGAILILTLVLYPYVYLLSRAAFKQQSKRLLEAHQLTGGSTWSYFSRIALPLARPAVFGGLALVLMETLADYGTVEYFGVNTLTTGILKAWFGMGSLTGAAQIASILLVFVIVIMMLEKHLRGSARYDAVHGAQPTTNRIQLNGWYKWLATLWCGLIVFLGFILPMWLLFFMLAESNTSQWLGEFMQLTLNSIALASTTAVLTVSFAMALMHSKRNSKSAHINRLITGMGMGYAIPGLVIAVGVTIAFGWLDAGYQWLLSSFSDNTPKLIFSGGFLALITAYVIRFLAVAMQPIDAAYQGIKPHLDEVSLLTGKSKLQTFKQLHLPLLKSGLLTALLLVFVDLLKELPATLVLRPFNFNTLAVKTYELASDERLADAALPALCIVAVGLLPVLLINKRINA